MPGLPRLLALFSRPGGGAARDPNRHGSLALQQSQGVRGLQTLPAPLSHAPTAAPTVSSSGKVMRPRTCAMSGQLVPLTLFASADGRTVGHNLRRDDMALPHS